jgi:c-di-GMP-binding flagellar brake protein YcgR
MPHASLDITATREISVVVSGDVHESSHSPEEYLRYCCEQPVRTFAPQNRIQLNFNAVLSRSPDITNAERTVCIDISPGGCFLFTVNEEIVLHSSVWVSLIILNDSTPIASTVCSKKEWGIANEIPGVGIRFDKMTEQQQTEMLSLCRDKQKE